MFWNAKELSEESIKPPATSDNSFAPRLAFIDNGRKGVTFKEICLIQDNIFLPLRNAVNLFTVYELDTRSRDLTTDSTLGYLEV